MEFRVAKLARSIEYYTQSLGFGLLRTTGHVADLGATAEGPCILSLSDGAGAKPPPADAAGLFHAALLLPSQAALGAWLKFAAGRKIAFAGFSDHGVSSAIYLSDPDGNGLEFYADHPRARWPFAAGELAMTTRPLDVQELLALSGAPEANPLSGAVWGHLHLKVTNLDASEEFYTKTLGVQVTQGTYPGARFLAADDYHHHVALNIWGRSQRPKPQDTLGLSAAVFARVGLANPTRIPAPEGYDLLLEPLK